MYFRKEKNNRGLNNLKPSIQFENSKKTNKKKTKRIKHKADKAEESSKYLNDIEIYSLLVL